jgi:protein O-mannosyl-transferase
LANYLVLLVWPARLSPDYSYSQIPLAAGAASDWIACIVVVSLAVLAARLYPMHKVAFFAAGFAFVTLLPVSNLVVPIGTIMAERFLYLPAVGLLMVLTLALYSVARRTFMDPVVPFIIGLLIVSACVARTWIRNADWRDDVTLWSAAVEASPNSFKTHIALAKALLHTSDPDSDKMFVADLQGLHVLDTLPDKLNDANLYYDVAGQFILIGDSLRRIYADGTVVEPEDTIEKYGDARTAVLHCLSILRAQHRTPSAFMYLMLSQIESRLGDGHEALRAAHDAREVEPMVPTAYMRIHDLLFPGGWREEATSALMEGWLLTGDSALLQKLVEEYSANPDVSICAITPGQGYGIDSSCQVVRKQACAVSAEVVRLRLKASGPETAARLKRELDTKYGCATN